MMRHCFCGLSAALVAMVAASHSAHAEPGLQLAQYYERGGEGPRHGERFRDGYGRGDSFNRRGDDRDERRTARFRVGQSVLAQSQGGPRYFPGVVTRIDGDMLTVFYASSLTELRPSRQVRPYDWRSGDRVWCFYGRRAGGPIVPARIERLDVVGANTAMTVRYDNGEFERTTSAWCHSQ